MEFFHWSCRDSEIMRKLGKIQRKSELFLRFAQVYTFLLVLVVNFRFQCLKISTGSLSFWGHLKNATGSLSFLAKIVLSYWIRGVFSSLSFFNFGQKKSLNYRKPKSNVQMSNEIPSLIIWICQLVDSREGSGNEKLGEQAQNFYQPPSTYQEYSSYLGAIKVF